MPGRRPASGRTAEVAEIAHCPSRARLRRLKRGSRRPARRSVTRPSGLPCATLSARRAARHVPLAPEIGEALDLPGERRGPGDHPEGAVGSDLGRLPVGLVQLGGVVDEALGGDRDVDPEAIDGDAVRRAAARPLPSSGARVRPSRRRRPADPAPPSRRRRTTRSGCSPCAARSCRAAPPSSPAPARAG